MNSTDTKAQNMIVVAIDGPSGAGKGTIAKRVATELGYHFLDSGAVYRAAALGCVEAGIDLADDKVSAATVKALDIRFPPQDAGTGLVDTSRVFLGERDITSQLRSEVAADSASRLAVLPSVREVLLPIQREFLQSPGLVADGRDMGTVVFPGAEVKIFMTASAHVRAERRLGQLKEHGIEAKLESLVQEIAERDDRDANRAHAPMKEARDAVNIDTTSLDIDEAAAMVIDRVRQCVSSSNKCTDGEITSC